MNDSGANVEQGQDAHKKSFLSPSRVLLWVLALAGVVLIAMEQPPKSAWRKSSDAIKERLPSDEEMAEAGETEFKPFTKGEELDSLIKGNPVRKVTSSSTGSTETFTWKSLLKEHTFTVTYNKDDWVMGIRSGD